MIGLIDYITEYVSGRTKRNPVVFTEKDKLNDWISKLESLRFDVEKEEDQKDHWKWRDERWEKLEKTGKTAHGNGILSAPY